MMLAGFWGDWGMIVAPVSMLIILIVICCAKDSKNRSFLVRLWRHCLPELDLFPPNERRRAFRRAMKNWHTHLSFMAMWILGYAILQHFRPILYNIIPLPRLIVLLIMILMFAGILIWATWLTRARIRCRLRQELISDGFLICEPCGYDLRGLTEPRCPECGTPFEMSSKSEALGSETESSQQDTTP